MFTADNFAFAVIKTIDSLLSIYSTLIIIRALISWFSPNPYNRLYVLLIRITEPVLGPLRRLIPISGIDISPIIAILLIDIVVKRVLIAIASSLLMP
jgi:YggT family protein